MFESNDAKKISLSDIVQNVIAHTVALLIRVLGGIC